MEEENNNANSEGGMSESGLLAGKFKSVDALLHAYGELEAEFTRRSQRLKALEERLGPESGERGQAAHGDGPRSASATDAPQEPVRGVTLMGAGGAGVIAPVRRPASISEAGTLALGYLKRQT